jgi:hypothetical protein
MLAAALAESPGLYTRPGGQKWSILQVEGGDGQVFGLNSPPAKVIGAVIATIREACLTVGSGAARGRAAGRARATPPNGVRRRWFAAPARPAAPRAGRAAPRRRGARRAAAAAARGARAPARPRAPASQGADAPHVASPTPPGSPRARTRRPRAPRARARRCRRPWGERVTR